MEYINNISESEQEVFEFEVSDSYYPYEGISIELHKYSLWRLHKKTKTRLYMLRGTRYPAMDQRFHKDFKLVSKSGVNVPERIINEAIQDVQSSVWFNNQYKPIN